jgi:hypothetical protein
MRLRLVHVLGALGLLAIHEGCSGRAESRDDDDSSGSASASGATASGASASGATGSTGSGGGGPCDDGDYLLTVSSTLDATHPFVFDADLVRITSSEGVTLELSFQALAASDRSTPVGPVTSAGPFAVNADGTFTAVLPTIDVPAEANPISGSAISVDVILSGSLCVSELHCGTLTGTANESIPLDGSTWTLQRLVLPQVFPEPPIINCQGELADPL